MSCQQNNFFSDYNQCTGVTPQWFIENDGCTNVQGCIPIASPCQPTFRRFSPYCQFLEVTPAAPQLYLRVAPSPQQDASSLTFAHTSAYAELRRKGIPDLLATYQAWRRDENGYIGFYFDDAYFAQPTGYYLLDIFLDCSYCFSVNLRKPRCEAVVMDCYVQPVMETCGTGDCNATNVVGFDTAGGLVCTDVNPNPVCAGIAPYFPLDNPQVPVVPPCPSAPCCVTADTTAGSTVG